MSRAFFLAVAALSGLLHATGCVPVRKGAAAIEDAIVFQPTA
jgi:hypothetical protein